MNLLRRNILRIFCLFGLFCIVNAGISDVFHRWFPRTQISTNAPGRPDNLSRYVVITEDDDRAFNETLKNILIPRVPGTEGHEKVAKYIVNVLRSQDWDVEEDRFMAMTPMGKKEFNNIIATFNPNGCRKMILGCHYDSKFFSKFEFLAASDSAVPCAMILELARILNSSLKNSLKDVALQLVFFDGEEAWVRWTHTDSLYGSKHLVRKWKNQAPKASSCPLTVRSELDRLDLFMLLDLIGEKHCSFCNSYTSALPYYSHLSHIEGRLAKHNLFEDSHPYGFFSRPTCGFGRIEDDHYPFELAGIRKILHLIATPFPRVWHRKTDDASMIHYPTVRNLLKVFRVFLVEHLNLKF